MRRTSHSLNEFAFTIGTEGVNIEGPIGVRSASHGGRRLHTQRRKRRNRWLGPRRERYGDGSSIPRFWGSGTRGSRASPRYRPAGFRNGKQGTAETRTGIGIAESFERNIGIR